MTRVILITIFTQICFKQETNPVAFYMATTSVCTCHFVWLPLCVTVSEWRALTLGQDLDLIWRWIRSCRVHRNVLLSVSSSSLVSDWLKENMRGKDVLRERQCCLQLGRKAVSEDGDFMKWKVHEKLSAPNWTYNYNVVWKFLPELYVRNESYNKKYSASFDLNRKELKRKCMHFFAILSRIFFILNWYIGPVH